jgi:hypothetical protein
MAPIQPTHIWKYLSRKRVCVPKYLAEYFYVSWEDALWDLLKFFQIQRGVALVPEFFCSDVIKNMRSHGLRTEFYPTNANLQTDPTVFATYLHQFTPDVVVVLHADGITNRLLGDASMWLHALPTRTLLIEDSVHRVVDPQAIHLVSERHLVIDSLRKVTPLYGSTLYGDAATLSGFRQNAWWATIGYQVVVFFWWASYQLCLELATLPWGFSWQTQWNQNAERAMIRGYNRMGDNVIAGSCPRWFHFLARHLDIQKIKTVKKKQVEIYKSLLLRNWKSPLITVPFFEASDAGELRGFPVIFQRKVAAELLPVLRNAGLLLRAELDDSPWSQRQSICYLPLGPHLTDKQIREVCNIFRSCCDKL